MQSVTVFFRDGKDAGQRFTHEPRAGGSYSLRVRYDPGWVVVTDEWGHETAFPADRVLRVEAKEETRPW